jgi:hypothetical protein
MTQTFINILNGKNQNQNFPYIRLKHCHQSDDRPSDKGPLRSRQEHPELVCQGPQDQGHLRDHQPLQLGHQSGFNGISTIRFRMKMSLEKKHRNKLTRPIFILHVEH